MRKTCVKGGQPRDRISDSICGGIVTVVVTQ